MAQFTLFHSQNQPVKLNDANEIHRGGEGRILTISGDSKRVAKIYHPHIQGITKKTFRELQKLKKSIFVIPQLLLFDRQQKIAGFIMEYLPKEFVPLSALFSKNYCSRHQIGTKTKQKIAIKLIETLKYAHQNGIVIGDFNQYNVLVTHRAEVRLIDTDSFQTPENQHSGLVLEDIRDYLYGGKISRNADYFALSVLLFYLFTHTHPFKGIHKTVKGLMNRMIQRIPIFKKDPDLKVPKCYLPMKTGGFFAQFERHYIAGERFLISMLSADYQYISTKIQIPVQKITRGELQIKPILENTQVQELYFTQHLGVLYTADNYLIFSGKQKGQLIEQDRISRKNWDDIYLTGERIFLRRAEKLFFYQSSTEIIEIRNFKFEKEFDAQLYGNVLLVLGAQTMTWLYLDDYYKQTIKSKRTEVFSPAFRITGSFSFNSGGVMRIFYNIGGEIAGVKLPVAVKQIQQKANVGMVQYIENQKVINKYFRIDGLKFQLQSENLDEISDFAYMPSSKNLGYIFEPADNKILVKRSLDFTEVSQIDCDLVTAQSKLQSNRAGIILWENERVYLLNKN